jgi:hypothetical protein
VSVVRVIGVFLFASPARANFELRWWEYSATRRFPLWDLPHRKHGQKAWFFRVFSAPESPFRPKRLVMAGLVPAIHVFESWRGDSWMPGTRPGMTVG